MERQLIGVSDKTPLLDPRARGKSEVRGSKQMMLQGRQESFGGRKKLTSNDFSFLAEDRPRLSSTEQEECEFNEQLSSYLWLQFQQLLAKESGLTKTTIGEETFCRVRS